MDTEVIIGAVVAVYPLITWVSRKTSTKIDDNIVAVLDKILLFWKKK